MPNSSSCLAGLIYSTLAKPGSAEKIEVMRLRFLQNVSLSHPGNSLGLMDPIFFTDDAEPDLDEGIDVYAEISLAE